MLKIGLTGNIGSGKSLVAKIFSTLGIPVYLADLESKKLLTQSGVKAVITRTLGIDILTPTGEIDRVKLAEVVFSDPASLNFLNSLLHPLVMKDFEEWCQNHLESKFIIQEAAIILEGGFGDQFDKIIHVSCPVELSIVRVMKRDNVTREDVLRRMQFQFDDARKIGLSDYIIRNDGTELIIPQVLSINQQLLSLQG